MHSVQGSCICIGQYTFNMVIYTVTEEEANKTSKNVSVERLSCVERMLVICINLHYSKLQSNKSAKLMAEEFK